MTHPASMLPILRPAFIIAFATASALAALAPADLRCEYRTDPLGVDSPTPRLSWILESAQRDQHQSAFHILVASSPELIASHHGDLWDSGKVTESETVGVAYAGRSLRSGDRCYWTVQVWDAHDTPSGWSAVASFEIAKLRDSDWSARWINDGRQNPTASADFYRDDPAPLFRREFTVNKSISRARLYVTGLGYYEARLNGLRVGDQVLDPGWTAYDHRVFYATFDVTAALHGGSNCLGVTLGNGWWNPLPLRMFGKYNFRDALPNGRPRFIAQLEIEFTDGSRRIVGSGPEWKVADGPVRFNNIYLGEIYDARAEQPGWDSPGFDDSHWRSPALATEPLGRLQAQPQPPIRPIERFAATAVSQHGPDSFIYDLGRNFAGWASVRLRASAGAKIVFRYGELLHPDGSLNPMTSVAAQIKGRRKNSIGVQENTGGPGSPVIAEQTDTYIARGTSDETYTPQFTFHGFRYLEIKGLNAALPLENVIGIALSADVPDAGSFSCSNDLFNSIQAMCRRTFRANLFSVQSDCPHRERLGYGGDIVATSEAFMLNYDMANFYAKVVTDFADAARADGVFTDTAPFVGIQYCGVGWAMADPLLSAQLDQYYGDRRTAAENYVAAKRWLLAVAAQNPDGIIRTGLSDHESLTARPSGPMVTPLWLQSIRLVAQLARIAGHPEDLPQYEALAERASAAYQHEFVDSSSGRVEPGTQAGQAFALYSNALPPALRSRALDVLVSDITGRPKGHLTTGIMGTKYMLEALSQGGRADLAYEIANQRDFPSWGWMLANGATTLWETWKPSDNTYSQDHPMFGSVSEWFIKWLGGIQPAPDAHGFDHILIRPQALPDLQWVKSEYRSVRGLIVSNWRHEQARITFEITIPPNTSAEIHLPASGANQITESSQPLSRAKGISAIHADGGDVIFTAGSGHYVFTASSNL